MPKTICPVCERNDAVVNHWVEGHDYFCIRCGFDIDLKANEEKETS